MTFLRHAFALALTLQVAGVMAMTPYPQPEPSTTIEAGLPAPFVGAWSVALPTRDVSTPETHLAICKLPVRIEQADQNHILYLAPRAAETDAAIHLSAQNHGTVWEPIAGGPSYFTVWIDADVFYLYDVMPETEADWGRPYIYRRCV